MIQHFLNKLTNDRLYLNSLYLIGSSLILMGTGFVFWLLIARFFTSDDVGIATTIYSLLTTVSTVSLVGITSGLSRFLPSSKYKKEKINTSLTLISLLTCVTSVSVLGFLHKISPHLAFIQSHIGYMGLFVFFSVLLSINSIVESSLVTFRSGKSILVKNIILGVSKLILPVFFIAFSAFGIVIVMMGGVAISLFYSVMVLSRHHKIHIRPRVHIPSMRTMAWYSLGSYIGSISANLHTFILPILITNVLSPQITAYYTVGATIAGVIFMIPQVVSQNLLVEGSYDPEKTFVYVKKSLVMIGTFLIPAILLIWVFGEFILQIFGKEYSTEGLAFLRIYALSGIFVGGNYVFGTILYIQKRIQMVISVSLISSLLLIFFSVLFNGWGLVGIGYATIAAQALLLFFYLFILGFGKRTQEMFYPVQRIYQKAGSK